MKQQASAATLLQHLPPDKISKTQDIRRASIFLHNANRTSETCLACHSQIGSSDLTTYDYKTSQERQKDKLHHVHWATSISLIDQNWACLSLASCGISQHYWSGNCHNNKWARQFAPPCSISMLGQSAASEAFTSSRSAVLTCSRIGTGKMWCEPIGPDTSPGRIKEPASPRYEK